MVLRILVVEDSESDALLIIREIRKGGYSPFFERVDTLESLQGMLEQHSWDLIITDHSMPCLNSQAVLDCLNRMELDIPVIIVSGIIPEETAVATMKAGAQDYIMKDNLTRLIPAIERELSDARVRSARKKAESTITHMAYHDALTGLFNRSEFERRLQKVLENCWETGQNSALLYLDLDQFRIINETCGHVAGDIFLKQISKELTGLVRDSDTLARLGGDEFGILLENCVRNPAYQIAENVLDAVREYRFEWQEKSYRITTSIGFVVIDPQSSGVDDVMRSVDVACYAAKDSGRDRIRVYSSEDDDLNRREGEIIWVSRLNQALERNQFHLYRQSIKPVDTTVNEATNQQLLLCLEDSEGGVLEAADYLAAAEHYNLMPKIDRWLIKSAFDYMSADLNDIQNLGGSCFINISAASLNDPAFLNYVKNQFSQRSIPCRLVCFEINEAAALTQYSGAMEFIKEMRQLGCRVAINDFGSGLSSFSYLKSAPVDYLKISGEFVVNVLDDAMDAAIVEAVNDIAHIAGLQTIAKNVDNEKIFQKLKGIGVDFVQGTLLGDPRKVVLPDLQCSA